MDQSWYLSQVCWTRPYSVGPTSSPVGPTLYRRYAPIASGQEIRERWCFSRVYDRTLGTLSPARRTLVIRWLDHGPASESMVNAKYFCKVQWHMGGNDQGSSAKNKCLLRRLNAGSVSERFFFFGWRSRVSCRWAGMTSDRVRMLWIDDCSDSPLPPSSSLFSWWTLQKRDAGIALCHIRTGLPRWPSVTITSPGILRDSSCFYVQYVLLAGPHHTHARSFQKISFYPRSLIWTSSWLETTKYGTL